MEHIGIDLGTRGSHFCRRGADGQVLQEGRVPTTDLSAWLSKQARGSRVVIETCAQAFTIADQIVASGHEACVVPAAVVRQLGVGYRGLKNDERDARVLSKSSVALGSELPTVHVPSLQSRERQRLLTQRQSLVHARTQLVNGVKSQLRAELLSIRTGTTEALPKRVREGLAVYPVLSTALEPTLQAIEALTCSIKQLEDRLKEQTKDDAQIKRLMTMPGVGRLTAVALAAAVDDLERFQGAARLTSYLGLTPGEQSTGGKQRLTGITKAGKGHVRTLLIQAAWTLVRVAPQSALGQWFNELCQRRPKQVAIVAVARKMVRVLLAMMRTEQPFNPSHNERAAPTSDSSSGEDQRADALRLAVATVSQEQATQR